MPLQITITIHDNGGMELQGFPENPIMAMGIMECAKQGMAEKFRKDAERQVQLAAGPLVGPFSRS